MSRTSRPAIASCTPCDKQLEAAVNLFFKKVAIAQEIAKELGGKDDNLFRSVEAVVENIIKYYCPVKDHRMTQRIETLVVPTWKEFQDDYGMKSSFKIPRVPRGRVTMRDGVFRIEDSANSSSGR